MSKKNTLFNYFSKSPKILPKQGVSTHFAGTTPDEKNKGNSPKEGSQKSDPSPRNGYSNTHNNKENNNVSCELLDVIWAKLNGYPWWPSIVCNHPVSRKHVKGSGKKTEVHVQFFDDPPTRSWVKLSNVKFYKGIEDSSAPGKKGDISWQKAVNEADKALSKDRQDRDLLITCTAPSDDDEMDTDEFNDIANSGKDDEDVTPSKKRRKLSEPLSDLSDDSEDNYKPNQEMSDSDSISSGVNEDEISEPESEEPLPSPVKNKKCKRSSTFKQEKTPKTQQKMLSFNTPQNKGNNQTNLTPSQKGNISVSTNTKAKLSLFSAASVDDKNQGDQSSDGKIWTHLTYDWLQDGKRKDKERRSQDHPDYNPRTIYIPDFAKKAMTPALRQWWEMKTDHFDTILFFKVGKFYELYHQDAVIAVNELGLLYMRGEYAHSGFPEIAFSRYANMLIGKGYKIARTEQTETPAMMEARCKKLSSTTKFDKVVRREICRILSKGARTCSFIDGNVNDYSSCYLLAIKETICEKSMGDETVFGVCFIDTTIGKFHMGQFEDDRHRSRLRTLISHYPPAQLLLERRNLSCSSLQVLETNLSSVSKDFLTPGCEFWQSKKTLKFLNEIRPFCEEENCDKNCFPGTLQAMLEKDDVIGLTPVSEKDLAIQALGACIWYLQTCCIEQELLSMKCFEEYFPIDKVSNVVSQHVEVALNKHMVLDGITLQNLDILENGSTGTLEGTLLQRIDNCSTPFGKRLMRHWLCSPVCNPKAVEDRLNAVEDLMEIPEIVDNAKELLKKLPDLERLLSKIHTQGSADRSKDHPESRAIFFEETIYSKRKIMDFISALDGYKVSLEIIKEFNKSHAKLRSTLLKKCICYPSEDGKFPELEKHLIFFDNGFDHEKAVKDGKIIPSPGVDKEFDSAIDEIKRIEKLLDKYLVEQRKKFHAKINYFGHGKNRFQLEIPDQSVRHVTDDYELQSQRKGFRRYWTSELKECLSEIMAAEDKRDAALKDIMRKIFEQFDSYYKEWLSAVECLSVLDVLINLSVYSKSGNMCRPSVLHSSSCDKPFIEIRNGCHPCVDASYSANEFIPNDVLIATKSKDGNSPSLVIVTGPNMGGKSTLMRQTGLIVILAQLGCYVPASKCTLSPVDRIFTRLGASDRIMAGESTFFVELNETSSILQHATKHSLVLMDELGRGTATYDGTAIACAVVKELTSQIQCRTLFSTHYHSLVEDFSKDSQIKLGHMACMVENENEEDPSQETITFLYKFAEGACPKSYGFNAAKLAGIPEIVIREGHRKAVQFEKVAEAANLFRKICQSSDPRNLIKN